MTITQRLLLPEVLTKLKRIDLKARLVVEGFLTGLHRSPFKGFSCEFAEYRTYMPGDEPKRIDWKIYAKTDRFYVREYQEETNLKAYILLDASNSMSYTSDKVTKIEYGSCLAASLAYLLIKQRDSVGLLTFTTKINDYIPPRSTPTHLSVLFGAIDKIKTGGETDLANCFHQLAERIKRRGLVIIISDLFDDKERIITALRHFRHKKHEVLVFHILDKNEINFAFNQPLILKDLETAKEISLDPRVIRKHYQKSIADYFSDFKRRCRMHLIDYHLITTDMPLDFALLSYLQKRKRLQ